MCIDQEHADGARGFSLAEALVAVVLLGLLASLAWPSASAVQRRMQLDDGLRRLRLGLDRGRMAAERDRQPCALQLGPTGWQPTLSSHLPGCRGGLVSLAESGAGELELRSNLPDAVRFSTNGLVLDGGLVVLFHPSHAQALCLVIGMPLGISRSGIYQGDLHSSLSSTHCQPSDA